MQFSIKLVALVAAALAHAQSISDLPSCSLTCLSTTLGADGCSGLTDFACHCQVPNLVPEAEPCIESSCSTDDQAKVVSVVEAICSSVGYPISIATSGAAAATSTVAAATTGASSAAAAASTTAAALSSAATSAAGAASSAMTSAAGAVSSAMASASAAISSAESSASAALSSASASSTAEASTGAASQMQQNLGGLAAVAIAAAYYL